jgi:hypothetical protein
MSNEPRQGWLERDKDYHERVAREADEQTIAESTGETPSKGWLESDTDYRSRISLEANERRIEDSTGDTPRQGWLESDSNYRDRVARESNEHTIADTTGDAPRKSWFENDDEYRSRISREADEAIIDEATGDAPAKGWLESDREYRNRIWHEAKEIRATSKDDKEYSAEKNEDAHVDSDDSETSEPVEARQTSKNVQSEGHNDDDNYSARPRCGVSSDRSGDFKRKQEEKDALVRKNLEWQGEIKRTAQIFFYAGPDCRAKLLAVWANSTLAPDAELPHGISYWVCKLFDHAYGLSDAEMAGFQEDKLSTLNSSQSTIVRLMVEGRRETGAGTQAAEESIQRARAEALRQRAAEKKAHREEMENNEREWSEKQRRLAHDLCPNCGNPCRKNSYWDVLKHRKCLKFRL